VTLSGKAEAPRVTWENSITDSLLWALAANAEKELQKRFSQYFLKQIDERHLAFEALPSEIDALIGLGVARGHASVDPQCVLENLHYVQGRYFPRASLFETVTDYHDGEIGALFTAQSVDRWPEWELVAMILLSGFYREADANRRSEFQECLRRNVDKTCSMRSKYSSRSWSSIANY
jgi:hypothetical protein